MPMILPDAQGLEKLLHSFLKVSRYNRLNVRTLTSESVNATQGDLAEVKVRVSRSGNPSWAVHRGSYKGHTAEAR